MVPETPESNVPTVAQPASGEPESASSSAPTRTTGQSSSPITHEADGSDSGTHPVVPGYAIEAVLGRGGMGIVYKAFQIKLNRVVALKMILAGSHAGEEALTRFLGEAEAVAGLQHPHIVQLFEAGQHQGLPYFTLEFVPGGSLASKVREQPLSSRETAQMVERLARGMAYAHRHGVIHRDLKPDNVLLAEDGTPKIADFGLAKRGEGSSGLTHTGAIMGTPSYMAPEQASGRTHEVGPLADVYSLGAILYRLVTGRPPFQAETPLETIRQAASEEPVSPRQLQPKMPRDLETICLKCLEKDPSKRYASAEDLAGDLNRFLANEPIRARPTSFWTRGVKWVHRHPAVAALSSTTVLVVLLSLIILSWQLHQTETARAAVEQRKREVEVAREGEETQKKQAEKDRDTAVEARRKEAEARDLTEHELYLSNVALADREWMAGKASMTEDLLNRCPPRLRNWEWHHLLWRSSRQQVLRGARGLIYGVTFLADGKELCCLAADGSWIRWELVGGKPLSSFKRVATRMSALLPDGRVAMPRLDGKILVTEGDRVEGSYTLPGDWRGIVSIALRDDGNQIVSAGKDGTARVWDVASKEELASLTFKDFDPKIVALSPDGETVAMAGTEKGNPATVFRVMRRNQMGESPSHGGYGGTIRCLRFSPDGKLLAVGSSNLLFTWDIIKDELASKFPLQRGAINALAFSPSGTLLASGGDAQNVILSRTQNGEEYTRFTGCQGAILAIAFNADGKKIAAAGMDRAVYVWDVSANPGAISVSGAGGGAVAFSPDNRFMVGATRTNRLLLWDTVASKLYLFGQHDKTIRGLAVRRDSKQIASASEDGTIRLWDYPTFKPLRVLKGGGGEQWSVAYSPDGRHLATGGASSGPVKKSDVRIWNLETGAVIRELPQLPDTIRGVAYSPDGKRLALAANQDLHVYDLADGCLVFKRRHALICWSVAYSRDGRLLASCGSDGGTGVLRVWEAETGKEFLSLKGHTGNINGVAFSPDGRRIASAGLDASVRLWEIPSGREVLALNTDVMVLNVAFSPDGRRIAAGKHQSIDIWEAPRERQQTLLRGHLLGANAIAFHPETTEMATAGQESHVRIWDRVTCRSLRSCSGHDTAVLALAYSADGTFLASASGDSLAKLWDARTGEERKTLKGHTASVLAVAVRPDGLQVATGSADGTARLWDAATGKEVAVLAGHKDMVASIAYNPDATRLITTDMDGIVRIWDVAKAKEDSSFKLPDRDVCRAIYTVDGQHIVTSGGSIVRVWDTEGKEKLTLKGNKGAIHVVTVSPDGRRIAAAGEDRTVRVWSARSGKLLLELKGHEDQVKGLAFSKDSRLLGSAAHDETVRVWDVTGIEE